MEKTINLIKKALEIVTDQSNSYIYENIPVIDHTIVVTFSESHLFAWHKRANSHYEELTFPHKLSIDNLVVNNWSCAPIIHGLEKNIPEELLKRTKPFPLISGVPFHIYGRTEEEYIATIIERLSFAYFNIQVPTMFFNHETNLSLIKESLSISNREKQGTQLDLFLPFHPSLREVFPTCAILDISERFLPAYSTMLNEAIKKRLAEYYDNELNLNQFWNLSHLEDAPHAAYIIAPLLRSKFRQKWPQALLKIKDQQLAL
jgi:hypothetical protein